MPINDVTVDTTIDSTPIFLDLDDRALYLNRELTWLEFNRRVLHEAEDERTPLLERVKFLAIVANNLDEFFMKRIGGLKQQIANGVLELTVDGRNPQQQIQDSKAIIREIHADQKRIYDRLLTLLEAQGIGLIRYQSLSKEDQTQIRDQFYRNIFPILTPLAMDPAHPFPFISNLTLSLLVTLRFPSGDELYRARIKVPIHPDVSSRFVKVGATNNFVTLEDIIANNVDMLFPGMEICSCELFRVTRNAHVEKDEATAEDLLEMIESELRERQIAPVVRLEIEQNMNPIHCGMLTAELKLNGAEDVFSTESMIAMRDLFEIAALDIPSLHDTPHRPVEHPMLAFDRRSIFYIIRDRGALLLMHPYEPFSTTVERFLRTAADDPKVLAIKMTLYRTGTQGNVIDSLVRAARNGKQVVVMVELKARFDEAANIRWARSLEQAGIHVTYGVIGLKIHCKLLLVVRKDYSQLRRYVHISTGNYHSGTARLYTDLGLFSCDEELGQDVTELFNYLTGYSPPPAYRKILAAPYTLKRAILEKIQREIKHVEAGNSGHIQMKMNALEDVDITRALYRASQANVKIDLIVRDTCRLRPGIPGLSHNIRVVSIVGRFLEHGRILYFANNGTEEYFIGSADMMQRNLQNRVEVVVPVEDPELRQELRLILDVQLGDPRSAWDMQPDGSYIQRGHSDLIARNSQETLIAVAEQRMVAAEKHREKRVRSQLVSHFRRRLESNLPKT
jgi:polyphosphate kinase